MAELPITIMVRRTIVDTYEIEPQEGERRTSPLKIVNRAVEEAMKFGWDHFRNRTSDVESEKIYYSDDNGETWVRVKIK